MNILVCGAGTMGSGIAQVLAEGGHKVYLRDITDDLVSRGINNINKNLSRNVEKGKMTKEMQAVIMANITATTSLDPAKNSDLVLEAIIEDLAPKKKLMQELETICPATTIFASNTSALSITELAAVTNRPAKFIGMHFFNPAPVMKLVEITRGAATSEETYKFVKELTAALGKTPVTVEEAPGFIVNRVLIPMINEAAFILMEGVASAEDIDTSMKLGANHPIGPLALGDLIGLDVCLSIMETLYQEFGDTKYRACPLLIKMVRAGYLGRKTGRGFFTYQ